MNLNRKSLLKVLKYFDGLISEEVEIIICGGACGIIEGYIKRTTIDVDVIFSFPKISNYKEEIEETAGRFELGDDWLNDSAKGFEVNLPADFKDRLKTVDNGFRKLKLSALSRIDFFIMKLSSMRPGDLDDIEEMKISKEELAIITYAVRKISKHDPKTAMKMDLFIREYAIGESR
jgi:hypothetical protein